MKSIFRVIVSASMFGSGAAVYAQHHHHGATPWHRHQALVDPHGHRVVTRHDDYRHVIASQPRFAGTYYTYNNAHYYYPSQPVVTAQNAVAP